MEHIPVIFILAPLIAALFQPILFKFWNNVGWIVSIAVCTLNALLSLFFLKSIWVNGSVSYWLANWEPPWGIEYRIDLLNAFILVIISGATFFISLYSKVSVEHEIPKERQGYFYSLFLLHITGLNGIIITGDLFNLYVFLEITALSAYGLVAVGKSKKANVASLHFLILGTVGATFYLLGVGYLYLTTGTLNMEDLFQRLQPLYENPAVKTGFVFITLGLAIKLAVFPLHTWQPKAYGEAPSVVSVLLASTGTKVAAYVLIRILYSVFSPDFHYEEIPFREILMFTALISMMAGSILALQQTDMKRMLAYSSMGQIGYILLGIAIGTEQGLTGSLIHILNHAMMKGTLFFVVGAVVYRYASTKINDYKGLGKTMPLTAFSFFIAACSMVGVPGTVGFVSKWTIAMAALNAGYGFVIPFLLISALLSAIYFWRIINLMYFEGEEKQGKNEAPIGLCAPTITTAVLCVILGLGAYFPLHIAGNAIRAIMGVI